MPYKIRYISAVLEVRSLKWTSKGGNKGVGRRVPPRDTGKSVPGLFSSQPLDLFGLALVFSSQSPATLFPGHLTPLLTSTGTRHARGARAYMQAHRIR